MPNIISDLERVPVMVSAQGVTAHRTDLLDASKATNSSRSARLPYQATHQVELLHLQAEIDALLQQLQIIKQQRLASTSEETLEATMAAQPVLALR